MGTAKRKWQEHLEAAQASGMAMLMAVQIRHYMATNRKRHVGNGHFAFRTMLDLIGLVAKSRRSPNTRSELRRCCVEVR